MCILVAYADTPEGAAALEHGERLASESGSELLVFDLDSFSTADDRSIAATITGPPVARWFARAKDSKDAVGDLIDLSEEVAASLIVVGVRRRSPIGKLVLGSNAQQLIIDSHLPVLAVKAKP